MKVTIIGAGNIGGSLAVGLAGQGVGITVTARHQKSLAKYRKYGINTSLDNCEAISGADFVFYAVKPWQIEAVVAQTRGSIDPATQTVVSMAPGIAPETFASWFSPAVQIAYVIPNTAAQIRQSMTFVSSVTASDERVAALKSILDLVGRTEVVPLDKLIAGTRVASCGIAYAMRYISAAEKGARELGLPEQSVTSTVCQTVAGAASMVAGSRLGAEAEIDRVTTPNGMTIKGLKALEAAGFSDSVVSGLKVRTAPRRRIAVKVGSNVLTREDGCLNTTRVSSLVDQIVAVRNLGYEVILITSGAVACGRSLIRQDDKLDDVQQRQLYSALGQVRLMDLYYKLFIDYGINIGQVLTMKKDFMHRREYGNLRNCMEVMLQSDVVPVVNENDTVSIKELMFTDNDELSGLVAAMTGCSDLVILTNVDGLYSGEPGAPGTSLIRTVRPGDELEKYISSKGSSAGRGGMLSKFHTATQTAAAGIRVIIANGNREGILPDVLTRPEDTPHTEFIPRQS